MKRHPALQDLSRDHFTALLRANHVRRALQDDPRVPPLDEARKAFLGLWGDELDLHFQEEDVDLLPHLQGGDAEADALRARLEEDHAALREGFGALEVGADDEAWDRVAAHLVRHVRWEEETLFQWFQDHLDEDALQRLWDASRRFRTEKRGPASVGPPSTAGTA